MTMILDGSNGLTMPTWTTTSRPTSPIIGAQGYNTTYGGVEVYNGSAWDLITGGPAFSVNVGTNQTGISTATFTKIAFNSINFDTANAFNTSNYRYTPTVPGYYQFNIAVDIGSNFTFGVTRIYKNGSGSSNFTNCIFGSGGYQSGSELYSNGSGIFYMNGTTDYVEAYVYFSGTTMVVYASSLFTGTFVRGQ